MGYCMINKGYRRFIMYYSMERPWSWVKSVRGRGEESGKDMIGMVSNECLHISRCP